MDYRGDLRPPRAARPHQPQDQRPPPVPLPDPARGGQNVSFQDAQPDRSGMGPRIPMGSAYHNEPEPGVSRKRSLVRPDREKIDPGHRQWYYRNHLEGANVDVMPSTTGNYPHQTNLRRGKSLLAREEDVHESGLALFKRGATLRRRRPDTTGTSHEPASTAPPRRRGCLGSTPGPWDAWMYYCYLLTCCVPPFLFNCCGVRSPDQRRAWREKMGLMSIVLVLMAGVGFLTFGFTKSVCGTPANRYHGGEIGNDYIGKSSVTIHGYDYDFSNFKHPATANGVFNGSTNPLYDPGWNLEGNDATFLFQQVNDNCLGLITKSNTSSITSDGDKLDWYFPCNVFDQNGTSGVNLTGYETNTSCHTSSTARADFSAMNPQGQVYFTWDDVSNGNRNLAVFGSAVLDLDLLNWLSSAQVDYPSLFDDLKVANGTFNGKDLTMFFLRSGNNNIASCLEDVIRIGFIDTDTIGCVASDVVLYLSLIFIVGVVVIRFFMAVLFQWFFSWRIGNFPKETYEQRMQRSTEIENWSRDIYSAAPSQYRPNVGKGGLRTKPNKRSFFPSTSRFTPTENLLKGTGVGPRPGTTYNMLDSSTSYKKSVYASSVAKGVLDSPGRHSKYADSMSLRNYEAPCPFPLHNVVPQPPPDYEPFNFPLVHTIALVTAYSESVEGLRTTLDSLATTDYPNSHKMILVIADGMVKGSGNDLSTPEIVLTMMKDFITPPQEVEPHSYVAIADGHKRHNMAKVYAGFYLYDDATIERSKQQRVPIVLVAKCGNPLEANDSKPGNRGKRDSQIMLMAFLQKVMFDERMTTFEYEFFNSMWRVTGVSPDRYELVLCVDADTKVFPDSLTRMVSCMVHDEEIMGLCGETKIANKGDTFVTMMQVFEYYISHHLTKAFESMFGGVTCLPGCFSMYRIRAQKGDSGYWVPILANPDIVERYSENVVDTLHKKNLLLLGEDRYLTTLLLKTFPKRKNMFCPQAVCKTIVPDTFRVLLSQRRRWINSTVHNLFELVLVRDLCGTFCFSMQFVVGMELAGTLVLPAAISFTLYLIIDSAIPGGSNNTIPLILLAIVLGLPGVLIVITSKKVAYVGWMVIYLLSLPVWNGVLPAYAYWHFDDFSWGQTRMIAGESKNTGHDSKEGEFDSSHIVMKRWAEFERDRRWKSGTQSRDSMVYGRDSNRYSLASNSDGLLPPSQAQNADGSTTDSGSGVVPRQRHDSNALLMLPAPLSVSRSGGGMAMSSNSSIALRSSEENYMSEGDSSNLRLIPSPHTSSEDHHVESVESGYEVPLRYQPSGSFSPSPFSPSTGSVSHLPSQTPPFSPNPYEDSPGRGTGRVGNRASDPSSNAANPFRPTSASPVSDLQQPLISNELEETEQSSSNRLAYARDARLQTRSSMDLHNERQWTRGVSLTDSGPVPGPEGVRRVARPNRRPTSQAPAQNRYSRTTFALPPGTAAPQPGGTGNGY